MIKELLNKLKCLTSGHVAFQQAGESPVFIQKKTLGNETRTMLFCSRCDMVYVTKGELTKQELEIEAMAEQKLEAVKERLKRADEESLQKILENNLAKDGKNAIN